ncbi:S1/P1 nuclease [soil metagenome]
MISFAFSSFPALDNSLFSIKSSLKIQETENMSKKSIKTLLLLAFVFIFALPAFAWDDTGHKLTAYIAWQQMTPDVREKVTKILLSAPEDSDLSVFYLPGSRSDEAKRLELFMIAATWADIVRDRDFKVRYEKYHHSNWHYADTFWTIENGQVKILPNPNEDGGKAVEKLFDFEKVLKDADASNADKAIALAWVLHLGGDIHQPLHTSGRVTEIEPKGDQGGNLFLLTPKDTPRNNQVNLHWFWDSIVGRSTMRKNDACDSDYLRPIAAQMMKKYPFAKMQDRLNLGKFDVWQQESFKLATTEVFPPTLIRFQMPSENYKKNAFKIAQQQIALAGYRLGTMFNQIFGK